MPEAAPTAAATASQIVDIRLLGPGGSHQRQHVVEEQRIARLDALVVDLFPFEGRVAVDVDAAPETAQALAPVNPPETAGVPTGP